MALLTTFCHECARTALLDELHFERGKLPCPVCGAELAIVPGCSFTNDDRALFDELVQVVREAPWAPAKLRQLAAEVAQTLRIGTDTTSLLERLTVPFPGLLPVQTTAGRNENARRQVLRVLRAVLEAMSLQGA